MNEENGSVIPDFCDMCGRSLDECTMDYRVVIEVISGDMRRDIGENVEEDVRDEIERLIMQAERKSEAELMDSVYRRMRFIICPNCQKQYIRDPLPEYSGGAHGAC